MLINRDDNSGTTDSSAAIRWSMLVAGLTLGLLAMDLMVRRPLMREMTAMKSELRTVERDMEQLVGVRNQVWETNNLLTSLRSQHRQLEEARASLSSIQQLRKEVEVEADKATQSFARFDRLVNLQDSITRNTDALSNAEGLLTRLIMLQNQVIESAEQTGDATAAIDRLAAVRDLAVSQNDNLQSATTTIQQLGELKTQVLSAGEGVEAARDHVGAFAALKTDVFNSAGDLPKAQDAATSLISLKSQLIGGGEQTDKAFEHTGRLFALRDKLADEETTAVAADSLASLLTMSATLSNQSERIAESIGALELLTGLTDELSGQVAVVESMRKSLLDIVLLESTVKRVRDVMEPLAQLGNLRRMSAAEVQEAARVVLESRTATRQARSIPELKTQTAERLNLDGTELFADEPLDLPIPMPRDIGDDQPAAK